MMTFSPRWVTEAGTIGIAGEGDFFSVRLRVDDVLTMPVPNGDVSITLPEPAVVSRVVRNSTNIPFTEINGALIFSPVYYPSVIEIFRSGSITYSLSNGALPPGLSLSPHGLIEGTIATTIREVGPIVFDFTIRASNRTRIRDRAFRITVESARLPASIDVVALGVPTQDNLTGVTSLSLGTRYFNEAISIDVPVFDPDHRSPPLRVRPLTGFSSDLEHVFSGMPEGMTIEAYRIGGTISTRATPGLYLFELVLDDPTEPPSVAFRVSVSEEVAETVQVSKRLSWATKAGRMATMRVGEPAFFGLSVDLVGEGTVTYRVVSGEIPKGLRLNSQTGLFAGLAAWIEIDKEHVFTVRATSDDVFIERTFSILVKSSLLEKTYHLAIPLTRSAELSLMDGYDDVIARDDLFRPDDIYFGLPDRPSIYLINGLDGRIPLEPARSGDGSHAILNPDYHGPFKLILGGHRKAVARSEDGSIIYEVIFRPLYDPAAGAGGFSKPPVLPIREEKVVYPQSGETTRYVYPISLRNMRYDLARDVGLATNSMDRRHLIGLDTDELMPLWMRSPQVRGDLSSRLGFVPAVVVAYLKPGRGDALLDLINFRSADFVPTGKVFHFDGTLAQVQERKVVRSTLFETDQTSFDEVTLLDAMFG